MTRLRPAKEEDCQRFWRWRNEPAVREASFCGDPIPYGKHKRWFRQRLSSEESRLFVIVGCENQEVGYLRFDLLEGAAQVSIAVDPAQRGKGYATAALRQGAETALSEMNVRSVIALIKPDNLRSIRAFERAGFREGGNRQVDGCHAVEMTYRG